MTALKKTVRTRRGVEPAGRYLRRCCESNCPLKDLRARRTRAARRAGRRGSSSSAWVRSVAALWPWAGRARRAFAASTAAAPDRSALCDFCDSQRPFATPRPGPRPPRRSPRARRRAPGSVPSPRCGFHFSRDALRGGRGPECRNGFSPRGRARGADAAQEGSGALGGRVLAGSYFLGTPIRARRACGRQTVNK